MTDEELIQALMEDDEILEDIVSRYFELIPRIKNPGRELPFMEIDFS